MKSVKKFAKRIGMVAAVIGTIYLFDFALSLMSQPSDLLLISGMCLLFLLFMFWIWMYSRYKKGQFLKKAQEFKETLRSPWITPKENEGEKHDATKDNVASNSTPIDAGRVRQ
jgi:hypothetical protein